MIVPVIATSTSDIVDHILTSLIPVLPILVGLWLQNRKQKERVENLSGEVRNVHKEIKSPNGATTGKMVEEVKRDVKETRQELSRVAVAVGELQRAQKIESGLTRQDRERTRDSSTRSRSGDRGGDGGQPRRSSRRGGSTKGA